MVNPLDSNSEDFARKIIGEYIFPCKNLKIGDNQKEKLPDIYSSNKDIGIEVTKSELKIDHIRKALSEYCNKDDVGEEECKEQREDYEKKQPYSQLLDRIKNIFEDNEHLFGVDFDEHRTPKATVQINSPFSRRADYTNILYDYIIKKKCEKIRKGLYDGVEKKYLCVISIYRNKDFVEFEKVKKIFLKHNTSNSKTSKFSGFIIIFTREVYFYSVDINNYYHFRY